MTDSGRENTLGIKSRDPQDGSGEPELERQRRIAAMRAMSRQEDQTQVSAVSKPAISDATRQPRRSRWLLPIALGLIALVVGGSITGSLIASKRWTREQSTTPSLHAIDLSSASLYCPQAPVWAPDGRYLAVVGSDVNCMRSNAATTPQPLIGIFDVSTGKLQRLITIKDVLAQHRLVGAVSAIAWSPDSKTLALFGVVLPTSIIGVNHPALILYSMNNAGNNPPQAIIAPLRTQPSPGVPERLEVWNLRTMAAQPAIDDALPPALTYRWTADGQIVPSQSFPSDAARMTGRIASSGAFTFWQAGELVPMALQAGRYDASSSQEPAAVFFTSQPVLWSPDSQYVVFGIGIGGPVVYSAPPTPGLSCPDPGGSKPAPCLPQALPLPDRALAAIIKAVEKGETLTPTDGSTTLVNWPEVPVAWSPNGKYLLTILPGSEEHDGAIKTTVTVFDTKTGNALKQFQQRIGTSGAPCGNTVYPAWSPTGVQIALSQCSTDSIILWDTHNLSA